MLGAGIEAVRAAQQHTAYIAAKALGVPTSTALRCGRLALTTMS
jgi:hypothetical protein